MFVCLHRKSLCYQTLPFDDTKLMVIGAELSTLITLMENQVEGLRKGGIRASILRIMRLLQYGHVSVFTETTCSSVHQSYCYADLELDSSLVLKNLGA